MSLINREALYEKACDLEAQALAYVGKIANDETKIEEWKIWSAILVERTAFKHDIYDAPSLQPERKKDTIQKFHDYQVEWLKSHYDIELEPQLEEMIIRFLHDTANRYMMEEGG